MSTAKKIDESTIEVIYDNGNAVDHTPVGVLLSQDDYCAGEIVFTEKFNQCDLIRIELLQQWIELLRGELKVTEQRQCHVPVSRIPVLVQ